LPIYISLTQVQARLAGKVSIDDSGEDPNKISAQLALELMDQAEGDVELSLSPRYAAPFQTDGGQPFQALCERPTKRIIRTLCLNAAVMYILGTDFGKGSAVSGDEYIKELRKQSKSIIDRLMQREKSDEKELYRQWMYPPLPGLRLTVSNAASDDGFGGQIWLTGHDSGAFAANQADDPEATFWNGLGGGECDDGALPSSWRP
jgi:hypothetical protein